MRGSQQIDGRLSHHDGSGRGGKHGNQTDFTLFRGGTVPRNPNAVRSPQIGFAEVFGELLRRERELAARFASRRILRLRIVVTVHDELPVHRDRFFLAVVEIDPPSKTARRWLARLAEHIIRPDYGHVCRRAVLALLQLRLEPSGRAGERHRLTTRTRD